MRTCCDDRLNPAILPPSMRAVTSSSADTFNPAICGHRRLGRFGVPRRELSSTSREPWFASASVLLCANFEARTTTEDVQPFRLEP